jgi:hypothetical protein
MTTFTASVIFQSPGRTRIKHGKFEQIPSHVFQVGACTDSEESDYIWNKNTGDKVKFPYQKKPRELFWRTLPEGLSLPDKWARWMVELYELNSHSRLREIQEATRIFAHVLRTIVADETIPTPRTMHTKQFEVDHEKRKIIDAIYV